ncbi:urease accessory protein UreF [Pleurocapsales cyanobacterium LEGE 10410]|nr:urease accessory protein UreF [Pleurocapsales cyanobacterium LEGE 10410]
MNNLDNRPSTIKQKLAQMQLADSFFPSGSYTLSHGLESLVQQDKIRQPEDLVSFLQILAYNKIATCDLVALIHAYRAGAANDLEKIIQIDAQLFAQTSIAITRKTQQQSGRALLMVAQSTWQHQQLATLAQKRALNQFYCLHPIVFGVVGNLAGLTATDTALAFLHGLVTGILGAAIRLGILGHLQAQKILLQLAPDLEAAYKIASSMNLEQMWSCTPEIDLAQIHHTKLASRLFAN